MIRAAPKRVYELLQFDAHDGLDELKTLVNANNVNLLRVHDFSLLLLACYNDCSYDRVSYLVSIGADVNYMSEKKLTPLRCADWTDVIKLLLDRGAHVNVLNLNGHSILYGARLQAHWYKVEMLIDRGAVMHEKDWPPEMVTSIIEERKSCQLQVQQLLVVCRKSGWFCRDVMGVIAKHLWTLRFSTLIDD